ncbi:MFS transporter [Bifidobacterium samirii]|uniref:Transport protein n=1 Tax=Bifidobacterium samirii TaxID=2306974 RepID=A0A430FNP4_9BIFI|nr:MFS transporter [Bifidobacterium samirii]RSX54439.1 transport protein [Bifidobacterium samirii]
MTEEKPNEPTPTPPPLPGQYFVRPGIDDRPDYEKALSPEDKAAVARLAVPLRRRAPERAAAQASTQSAKLSASGSPAAAAAAVDTAIPDMASAFLDMRDPMTAADGTRPDTGQVRRLTWGFALAALLRTIPWIMLNMLLLPVLIDRVAGNAGDWAQRCAADNDVTRAVGASATSSASASTLVGVSSAMPLAIVVTLGCVGALFANALVSIWSDGTRTTIGRRTPWIIAGGIICALDTLILGAMGATAGIALFWIVMQFGYAMIATPLAAAFAERLPDKFRERSMRWRGVGLMLGQALGVVLAAAGLVVDTDGGLAFRVCAVMFVVCAATVVLVLPRERSSRYDPALRFTGEAFSAQFRAPKDAPRFVLAFWARLAMMTGVGFMTVFLWMIVRHGIVDPSRCDAGTSGDVVASVSAVTSTAGVMAMMAVATLVGSALAAAIAGRLADRVEDARRGAVPAMVAYAAVALLPWLVPAVWSMVVFAFVSGLALGVYDVFAQTLVMESLPDPRNAGHDLGVYDIANVVAPALAAVVGAAVAVVAGFTALPVAACVAALAAVGPTLALHD